MTDEFTAEIIEIEQNKLIIAKNNGGTWKYNPKGEIDPCVLRELLERQAEGWRPLGFATFLREEKRLKLKAVGL